MANTAPILPSASEAQPQTQTPHDRPRSAYPRPIQSLFRGTARRKQSLNDLGSALFSQPAGRPRTGSEACIYSPTRLTTDLQPQEQPCIDSGLTSPSLVPQRSATVRGRVPRRARSSFSSWLNDFRKEAGHRFRSRGHISLKSMGVVADNTDVSRTEIPESRNPGSAMSRNEQPRHFDASSIAPPRGRPLETLQTQFVHRETRTLSPAGGENARAAAAAMSRFPDRPRQLEASSSTDYSAMIRRASKNSDVESGIEVSISPASSTNLVPESRVAGRDPATLPAELFSKIMTFLDSGSLMNAEQVSKSWNAAATSDHAWKHVFNNEYIQPTETAVAKREYTPAGGLGLGKKQGPQQWKKMWRARRQLTSRWQDGHAAAIYLEGHSDSVYCAQFDEQKIVTGSRDWTVRIWDSQTLRCTHVLGVAKDTAPTHSSLDARTRHGKQPFVSLVPSRPAPDPIVVMNEERHTGSILCMQYDADIMVTGSSDSTLLVWSMKDYSVIKRLNGHRMGVLDVCLNDKYIVACSKDMNITVWCRETLELIKCLEGHRGPVNAVQMRGSLVCSASGDGVAKLWDLTTGLCIKEFQTPAPAPDVRSRGLACIEFTKDGRILAGGNDRTIYQFNTVTGTLEHRYEGHDLLVRSLHYDAANDRVVSGSYDHSVKAFDIKTQELICDFKDWTTSWMLSAKSDYRRIVATSQDARAIVMDFGFGLPHVDLLSGDS